MQQAHNVALNVFTGPCAKYVTHCEYSLNDCLYFFVIKMLSIFYPKYVFTGKFNCCKNTESIGDLNVSLRYLLDFVFALQEGENEEDTRILNRRSGQLLHAIQKALDKRKDVAFGSLVTRNHRKQVAAKFHTLLVLKKLCAVNVAQKNCFDKISITRGPAFDSIVLE